MFNFDSYAHKVTFKTKRGMNVPIITAVTLHVTSVTAEKDLNKYTAGPSVAAVEARPNPGPSLALCLSILLTKNS